MTELPPLERQLIAFGTTVAVDDDFQRIIAAIRKAHEIEPPVCHAGLVHNPAPA